MIWDWKELFTLYKAEVKEKNISFEYVAASLYIKAIQMLRSKKEEAPCKTVCNFEV